MLSKLNNVVADTRPDQKYGVVPFLMDY